MKIKSSYLVFGKRFKVKIVPSLEVQGIPRAGLMDPVNHIIYVQKDSSAEMQSTLLHELFHAMCDRIGLHQSAVPHDVFELLAESVSTFFTETFKLSGRR